MQYLIVFLVAIGTVLAEQDAAIKDPKLDLKAATLRMLDTNLTACATDADCHPGFPKCSEMMKTCKPEGAPEFEMEYGTCESCKDCRPRYNCKDKKCHFGGPKPCSADGDCLQGITGVTFECKENAKSAPGKRCWLKCSKDKDCYECDAEDKCKISGPAREKIGCCQGNCQKKVAC